MPKANYCVGFFQLFTNSDRQHVTRALARLGIQEACFDQIICFETMNPHLFEETKDAISTSSEVVLKPSAKAVELAVCIAGFDPQRMVCYQTPFMRSH